MTDRRKSNTPKKHPAAKSGTAQRAARRSDEREGRQEEAEEPVEQGEMTSEEARMKKEIEELTNRLQRHLEAKVFDSNLKYDYLAEQFKKTPRHVNNNYRGPGK